MKKTNWTEIFEKIQEIFPKKKITFVINPDNTYLLTVEGVK